MTQDITSQAEFEAVLEGIRAQHAQIVARNARLSPYKKVEMITKLANEQARMIQGYFLTRAALEHHKGVPKQDIYLGAYALHVDGIAVSDVPERTIDSPRYVQVGFQEKGRVLPREQEITLTEAEVEDIANTIFLRLVPRLAQGLGEGKHPQESQRDPEVEP